MIPKKKTLHIPEKFTQIIPLKRRLASSSANVVERVDQITENDHTFPFRDPKISSPAPQRDGWLEIFSTQRHVLERIHMFSVNLINDTMMRHIFWSFFFWFSVERARYASEEQKWDASGSGKRVNTIMPERIECGIHLIVSRDENMLTCKGIRCMAPRVAPVPTCQRADDLIGANDY